MTATSAPVWKSLRVCPADPLALSHPQANHSQSQGCRGEVSEESQHLIGDGLSDWMTEEVDFSSYLPTPPSPPSSTNASLPPSPLHNDIQVPSDLEVMTSLLQEELAQLEDYFLSEPLPEKGPRPLPPATGASSGPQPLLQLPYGAPYPASGQSEAGPLLVTLATGELDLLSICGGPIGRAKMPRHAPYGCGRLGNGGNRKRFGDGYDISGLSGSKGNSNNSGNSAVGLAAGYGCVEEAKSYCLGAAVEVRRCGGVLPKEEKDCCFGQDVIGGVKGGGFGFVPMDASHKKEELLMFSMREVGSSEATKTAAVSWKSQSSDGCYLPPPPQPEAYHGFLSGVEQVKAEGLQVGHHDLHRGFLDHQDQDQGPGCLLLTREGPGLDGHRQACRLQDDLCPVKYEEDAVGTGEGGQRKQKKKDQNKTAAHRYRQRKRAELSSLEEQLHGLEGRNRELRDKAESVEREIQYVKDLLIEVYKARSQRLKQDTTA